MMVRQIGSRLLAAVWMVASVLPSLADAKPHFTGTLVLTPLQPDDGRHFQLVEPYGFVATDGQSWPVPKGAVTDGASIPWYLWSAIGGPFEGKYRSAAVVHDYYCDVRVRTWQATDRMFYEGMIAAGVDDMQARIMYAAVRQFGPHWDGQTIINSTIRPPWSGDIDPINGSVNISARGGGTMILTRGIATEAWHLDQKNAFATKDPSGRAWIEAARPTRSDADNNSQAAFDRLAQAVRQRDLTLDQIDSLTEHP
jgi:hypothetical protein